MSINSNFEHDNQIEVEESSFKTHADVSSKEKMNGNIDCAKVTIRDASSGKVISTKRVVLLAS